PDVALLRLHPDDYEADHPSAADVLALMEVADSSLDKDCNEKAALYAENAIPEYWVIDLNSDTVIVHRGPHPDGTWASVTAQGRGDTLPVAALPGVSVAVAELLP